MKIELLADYRGVLTDERYYPAGVYTPDNMPESYARVLVDRGRAVLIPPKVTAPPVLDYSKMLVRQLVPLAIERGIGERARHMRKVELVAALEKKDEEWKFKELLLLEESD